MTGKGGREWRETEAGMTGDGGGYDGGWEGRETGMGVTRGGGGRGRWFS